jgi:hypothetical protein
VRQSFQAPSLLKLLQALTENCTFLPIIAPEYVSANRRLQDERFVILQELFVQFMPF